MKNIFVGMIIITKRFIATYEHYHHGSSFYFLNKR